VDQIKGTRDDEVDLGFEPPTTDEVEVDAKALAAIDRGIDAVRTGRYDEPP
jgi:hypothetical protein